MKIYRWGYTFLWTDIVHCSLFIVQYLSLFTCLLSVSPSRGQENTGSDSFISIFLRPTQSLPHWVWLNGPWATAPTHNHSFGPFLSMTLWQELGLWRRIWLRTQRCSINVKSAVKPRVGSYQPRGWAESCILKADQVKREKPSSLGREKGTRSTQRHERLELQRTAQSCGDQLWASKHRLPAT